MHAITGFSDSLYISTCPESATRVSPKSTKHELYDVVLDYTEHHCTVRPLSEPFVFFRRNESGEKSGW